MVRVGVIGLGMMGLTHLDIYRKHPGVEVVALSDTNPDRLALKAAVAGNIAGQAQGGDDLANVRRYDEARKLIEDPDVELVDVCLTTPMHRAYGEAVLAAGKHLMIEKPLARTAADAHALAQAAASAPGIAMAGMCMRFWPGWDWLKHAIDEQTYGPLRSLHLHRLASLPPGSFYRDGEGTGGAILDLHIHDTDFVQHCLGVPDAVHSRGLQGIGGQIDHVITHYLYEHDDAPLVSAHGGWDMAPGYDFQMRYVANFTDATAAFDIAAEHPLTLYRDGRAEPVAIPAGMGYEHELAYLIDCIEQGTAPSRVTLAEAAMAVQIVEAERESVASGKAVKVAGVVNS